MKLIFLGFLFIVGRLFTADAAKISLGEMIPVCDAKDPNLNACVVKSANLLIPFLAKGIKQYGFPPLDPLRVPRMDVGQNVGSINLKLTLIDTTHTGLSTLVFRSASIDTGKNRWILNGTLPYYSLEGRYISEGRILVVPVVGDGRANFTFGNTGVDFVISGAPKKQKDKIYFAINKVRVHFTFDKTHVSLTNLFNGNKALGEVTTRFLNDNSNEVVNGLKATLEDVYSRLYMNLIKRITSNVPYEQIFKNVRT